MIVKNQQPDVPMRVVGHAATGPNQLNDAMPPYQHPTLRLSFTASNLAQRDIRREPTRSRLPQPPRFGSGASCAAREETQQAYIQASVSRNARTGGAQSDVGHLARDAASRGDGDRCQSGARAVDLALSGSRASHGAELAHDAAVVGLDPLSDERARVRRSRRW
jgi:hypothetical protein